MANKKRDKKEKIDNDKGFSKMSIVWFPGHMAKTRRQITEDLKLVDVVVEILDARIPISSQNPDIKQITQNKKKVIILNKYDLADEVENNKWVQHFKEDKNNVVLVNSITGEGIKETIKQIEEKIAIEKESYGNKGRIGRKIRVMIVGIPNVGKSSFINKIAKKKRVEVANKPGVTKQKQWINVNDKIELMDTPGILWPKFESNEVAMNLAITGTIKDTILEITEIAHYLLKYLLYNYKEELMQRYSFETEQIDKILYQDNSENENIYEIMKLIGRKRGAIISGGNVDDYKTSNIILDDFRKGKIGRITLEKV